MRTDNYVGGNKQSPRDVTRPVTERQRAFIERLLEEKDVAGTRYEGWEPDWSRANTRTASSVIDYLLTLPRKTAPASEPASAIEAGAYRSGGTYYRVYFGQQSGQMLVKQVVITRECEGHESTDGPIGNVTYCDGTCRPADEAEVSMQYLGRADKHLPADAVRLTLEEAAAWGKATSHCMMCGRRLDVPESVDAGIGPKCSKAFGS